MHLAEYGGEEHDLYRRVHILEQAVAHQFARLGDLGGDVRQHTAYGDRLFVVRVDELEEPVVRKILSRALVLALFSRADIGYLVEIFRKRLERKRLFFENFLPLVERMAGKIDVERVLFVFEQYLGRKFRQRRHVVRLFFVHKVEKRKLTAALLLLFVSREVEHALVARHERRARISEAVERARLYQVFENALVDRARGKSGQHIGYALVRSVLLPLFNESLHSRFADVLDTAEPETQSAVFRLEHGARPVDVGRIYLVTLVAQVGQIFLYLVRIGDAVVYDRGDKLYVVIALEIRRLVREHRISRRVRLVERVFGKVLHFVEDRVCHVLFDPAFERAVDVQFFVSVKEYLTVLCHDVGLFLAHRAAKKVRASQRITCKHLHDLHDLFLVHEGAVGHVEYRLERRMLVSYRLRIVLGAQIIGYRVHRSRAVKRYSRYYIFEALRFEFLHKLLHARAFELEHRVRFARAYQFVHLGVVVPQLLKVDVDAEVLFYVLPRLADVGQGFESEEVHFEHTHKLDFLFLKLRGYILAVALKGDKIGYDLSAYYDARRMLGAVARHTLYAKRHVYDVAERGIFVVHLHDFGRIQLFVVLVVSPAQHLVKSDFGVVGDCLCQFVDVGKRYVVNARDVLYRALRLHRAESEYLTHLVAAVLSRDVFDDLSSSFKAEVHVEVGRRLSFGVEKTLEKQVVSQRIHVGDMNGIRDDASDAAASARADGYPVLSRVIDKVPDDQIVVRKAFRNDDVELVFRAGAQLVRYGAVSLDQSVVSHLAQIFRGRETVGRNVRRLKVLLFYRDVTLFHYLDGIRDRLRTPRKQLHHLVVRLHIEFVRVELHSRRIVDRLARLYAKQNVLHHRVLAFYVMHVVRRDDLDAYLARKTDEKRIYLLLLGNSVILKLDIKIPFFEHIAQHYRILLGSFVISREQKAGDPARKTRRTAYHAFRVLFEKLYVDARLVIKTVDVRHTVHLHEVAVAVVVFGYKKQMVEVGRTSALLVHILASVKLAADYRFYAQSLARTVHREHAEHIAVIGDRDARHTLGYCRFEQRKMLALGKPRGSVEQTHIRVDVQMHERFRLWLFRLLFLFFLRGSGLRGSRRGVLFFLACFSLFLFRHFFSLPTPLSLRACD